VTQLSARGVRAIAPLLAALLAAPLGAAPSGPALAQVVVYDPTNYAQNLTQAARALQQVNNQIISLQNEARMLAGQARNLEGLPLSSLGALRGEIARTQGLLGEARRLAYDVAEIDAAFDARYADTPLSTPEAALTDRARERWATAVAGLQDALKVQAGVVGGMETSRRELEALVGASQGAAGALQAAQAGNQLLALQSQQLAGVTALLAAQGRAQALDAADQAAARADAKARFARFMGKVP